MEHIYNNNLYHPYNPKHRHQYDRTQRHDDVTSRQTITIKSEYNYLIKLLLYKSREEAVLL